jgi:DME family drug/metabolite transporter
MKIDRGSAAILVVISGVLFGTTGTSSILADVEASPTSIGAARLIVGSLGLVAFSVYQRGITDLIKLWKRPRVWIMGLSVSSYMLSFFTAVKLAGAAVAALVAISLAPMIAGAIAKAFGKPWPGKVWVFSTGLAVLGVVLLSAPNDADAGNSKIFGALLAFIASASYAFYTVVGAQLVDDNHNATDGLAASFSIGALLLLPFLIMDSDWLFTGRGISLALWLGIATTTLAYALFGVGLTYLAPGVVATLLLSEPATATLLGVFVLQEDMSLRGWIGCLMILIGLVMVSVNERKKSEVIAI